MKTNKWAFNLFWRSSKLYLHHQFKNLRYNFLQKLLTVFPVNDFPVFLIPKRFMMDVKRFLGSRLHAAHQTCKGSRIIFLNVFKYKRSRFLQIWCKLNTHRIAKTCPFCFLHDYYGDSLNVTFPQFPNHFLPFPMIFPDVFPDVSTISLCVSTVPPQCFPHFLF